MGARGLISLRYRTTCHPVSPADAAGRDGTLRLAGTRDRHRKLKMTIPPVSSDASTDPRSWLSRVSAPTSDCDAEIIGLTNRLIGTTGAMIRKCVATILVQRTWPRTDAIQRVQAKSLSVDRIKSADGHHRSFRSTSAYNPAATQVRVISPGPLSRGWIHRFS